MYLYLYNRLLAALWAVVCFNTVFFGATLGQPLLFEKSLAFLIATQLLAVLEIVHAALGLVKSPIATTAAQVFSRLLIVLGVFWYLPHSPANHSGVYVPLTLLWGITEVVRYSYYALALKGAVPHYLTWLRYSMFYVLYPLGVASEVSIIYKSLGAAQLASPWYKYFLVGTMFTYPPGLYTLYTYMMRQRRKVLGKKAVE